jgi:hypothetical protein
MGTKQYPDFNGWSVEYTERSDGKHEFLFLKASEAGKNGKLTVWATTGAGTDPEIAYLVGKRDALAEDVRVSSPDDRDAATQRFDAAHRDVVAGKVRRRLAKGFDTPEAARQYVVERLSGAGFTFAEMGAFMGEDARTSDVAGDDAKTRAAFKVQRAPQEEE